MNVAELTLCEELYELSGWKDVVEQWSDEGVEYVETPEADTENGFIPAYNTNYLLGKFPYWIKLEGNGVDIWYAEINQRGLGIFSAEAESPANALCKLAIELWKQGILTKGKP